MKFRKMVVCMFAAFMVASCSNDELKDNDVSNVQREKCTLSFRVKPFVLDNDVETRSYFDFRQNKICDFYFESDDQFGICALDGSFNAPYPCTSVVEDDDEGDQVITLDAAPLHSMLRNKECIAYYPYNPLHSPDDFKVLFPFNIQKQNENSSDYLANNCNYFVSEPFCFDEYCKGYEIELHPVNSIFDVEVTLPNLENDKYRKIELVSTDGSKPFTEYVRYPISEDGFEEPIVHNEWRVKTTSLDISDMEITSGKQQFYIACFPTDKFGKFVIEATTKNGCVYRSDELSLNKKNTCKAGYGYKIKAQNMKKQTKPKDGTENGYEYVDLGLPSGLKWAKMNLGAMSETDYGKYYAWGETVATGEEDLSNDTNYDFNIKEGYTSSPYVKRICYHWTYKWNNNVSGIDTNPSWTKYCLDKTHGSVDRRTSLVAKDDAVIQNWGGSWRMPTKEEQKELLDNCYCVWTDGYNGTDVKGYIIYKALKISDKGMVIKSGRTPSNSYKHSVPHIFLPAAGFRSFGICALGTGEICSYLSSSLFAPEDCDDCLVTSIRIEPKKFSLGSADRCDGNSIRAVCE